MEPRYHDFSFPEDVRDYIVNKPEEEVLSKVDVDDQLNLVNAIGLPATFELLGEEASELAQASLKLARVLRGEMPTPVKINEAVSNLCEEIADVQICVSDLYEIYYKFSGYFELFFGAKRERLDKRLTEFLAKKA